MRIEFLVEEPSAEAALRNLVPKILGGEVDFAIHVHEGKADLLQKLPGRLRGYAQWLPEDYKIVVLIDEDRQDCKKLKKNLENVARYAGLLTKSRAKTGSKFQVLNRIAIEELEAWFFGDIQALVKSYPGVSPTLHQKRGYRNSDAIAGGTWEALERVLQKAGYFEGGLAKIEAARQISAQMEPAHNRSRSFQVFREGLTSLSA